MFLFSIEFVRPSEKRWPVWRKYKVVKNLEFTKKIQSDFTDPSNSVFNEPMNSDRKLGFAMGIYFPGLI